MRRRERSTSSLPAAESSSFALPTTAGDRARRSRPCYRAARDVQDCRARGSGGDCDARFSRRGAGVDCGRIAAEPDVALARQAARLASRGRWRRGGRAAAGRAGRRHDGDGAGTLFQHPGATEVPAHRSHRIRPLRGSMSPYRALAPGHGIHAESQRQCALPVACRGPQGAGRCAAGREFRRAGGVGRCRRTGDCAGGLGGASGVRDGGYACTSTRNTFSSTVASCATGC